jgi:membrane fusion protein, heavy metal efflux system
MPIRRFVLTGFALAGLTGLAWAAYWSRDVWRPWLAKFQPAPTTDATPPDGDDDREHARAARVKLSAQARANLRLAVEPVAPETYWKAIHVPGIVVDRPGESDRGVTAPVAGIVAAVHAYPGDTVRAGDVLFTLRVVSELVQNAQAELFKAARDLQLNREQLDRLTASGVAPEAKLIELQNQDRRLQAAIQAYRQELLTRGLTPAQIDAAADGRFVTEVTVVAPPPAAGARRLAEAAPSSGQPPTGSADKPLAYEVQDLRAQLGEQVQAGQVLSLLANHQALYVEGRAFKQEAGPLERAAQNGWPVRAEFVEDEAAAWPPLDQTLQVRHLANTVDPVSRTFAFYLPLTNQSRTYDRDGRTFLVWRFRPGQRVRLHVPVEEIRDVFVLPGEAVVKDGADVYVFRQNGDLFERKPVRLVHQDRDAAVVANDGSIGPGQYVARNAAATLNRILKAQAAAVQPGPGHAHDGHTHDH